MRAAACQQEKTAYNTATSSIHDSDYTQFSGSAPMWFLFVSIHHVGIPFRCSCTKCAFITFLIHRICTTGETSAVPMRRQDGNLDWQQSLLHPDRIESACTAFDGDGRCEGGCCQPHCHAEIRNRHFQISVKYAGFGCRFQ